MKTTFKLQNPTGLQHVMWAVCYDTQGFQGGEVVFGYADVGWNGAE